MNTDQWAQDLRHAWRGLRRARGFTAAAVLTLALGITATTVMFALVHGVLLRPLGVHDQDRLVVAWAELRSSGATHWPFRLPPADIEVIAGSSQAFEAVAGVGYNGAVRFVAVENDTASYVNGALVTGDFFHVLGVKPVLGRALTRDDDVAGAENVLVITHALWQRRYGGSHDVIGRHLDINERPFIIVGVMPPDLDYPRGVEAWRTVTSFAATQTSPEFRVDLDLLARLRPGVTLEQAHAEIQALTLRLEATAGKNQPRGLSPVVRSFEDVVVGDVRTTILVLFGAVGLVLIIASANVANLLLMRGEARRPEFAVRAALGAGRSRLARQLLAESVMLAIAAGCIGLIVTWWAIEAAPALLPSALPRVESVRLDMTVVGFTMAIALMTAVLAALGPAFWSSRIDLAAQLRSGGRGTTGGSRHGRRALVAAQVGLAVTVVAAAGLLTRTVLRLESLDLGIAAERLVLMELQLPSAKYRDRARHLQFLNEVVARVEAAPEIAAATPVHVPPFAGPGGWDVPVYTAEGQSAADVAGNPALNLESIHPNYFHTFEVPIVRGRAFSAADRPGAPAAAIVSEDVAARSWPGQDPIGKRIKMGPLDSTSEWRTVVGVVGLTRYRELAAPRATLYLPAEQFIVGGNLLVMRTASPVAQIAGLGRDRVRQIDPAVHVMRIAPFSEMLDGPLSRPRWNAVLLGFFAAVALLLSAVGLYAVMAAYVRQRDSEIGVRIALGATASNVRGMVLWEGLRIAAAGVAIGLAAAVALTDALRGLLFEVHPLDPGTLAAAVLLLAAVSLLACYIPARRAMRADPIAAIRGE